MKSLLRDLGHRLRSRPDRARIDSDRRSRAVPDHHWSFDHFRPFSGPVRADMFVSFLGDQVRSEFCGWGHMPAREEAVGRPPIDEEYFEWTDILEAALAAGDTFTFLELGAGWGRWSARAALAARQLGKRVQLGLAEGDPKHVAMIRANMADNGIETYRVYEVAVGGVEGETVFCVDNPAEGAHWFGQGMVGGTVSDDFRVGEYHGLPMFQYSPDGAYVVKMPQIPLSAVLKDYDFVDLADFDLQTAERDAIPEALDLLSAKVRRMHIGTHALDIEALLRSILPPAGWVCLRDYPGGQTNETSFGPSYFVDGVQTWVNSKLL